MCTDEHVHIANVWLWPDAEPAQTEWLLKSLSDCDALLCLHSICSSSEVAALMQRLHGRKIELGLVHDVKLMLACSSAVLHKTTAKVRRLPSRSL